MNLRCKDERYLRCHGAKRFATIVLFDLHEYYFFFFQVDTGFTWSETDSFTPSMKAISLSLEGTQV